MLKFDSSFQMIEETTLEQQHSCEVKTHWSDDAHKCDGEGDVEEKCARVEICCLMALNFGAVNAEVFFPFQSPKIGTDGKRTV